MQHEAAFSITIDVRQFLVKSTIYTEITTLRYAKTCLERKIVQDR